MTSTINSAGRVVIPKALRDRTGLDPVSQVNFSFHDGRIQVKAACHDMQWEQGAA